VVEARDASVPSMAQDSLALVQDSRPLQLGASFVGHCSGARAQLLYSPPEWDGRLVVVCGDSVVTPPPSPGSAWPKATLDCND
jgi:hypothetical protein